MAKGTRSKVPINSQFEQPLGDDRGAGSPNPATLAADIASLYPGGVVAAQLRVPGDPALLYPEESVSIARAVQKRVQEFAAGRLCARRALAEIGITGFPVRAGPDRAPEWPEAAVGSITHAAGYCAAVTAERRRYLALGLDAEVVCDLKPALWPRICVRSEIQWLESISAANRQAAAALIISAKEAFYKCQFPLTRERLTFGDLCVQPTVTDELDRNGHGDAVSISLTSPRMISAYFPSAIQCRYRFLNPYVIAAVWLPSALQVSDPRESAPTRAPTEPG
jgi:4'-phosphopantetheinyl transferase EntD